MIQEITGCCEGCQAATERTAGMEVYRNPSDRISHSRTPHRISNKIFCLMGKSASGKDTIYRRIMGRAAGDEAQTEEGSKTRQAAAHRLQRVIPCTTRPMRTGEKDGETYYFETDQQFAAAKAAGIMIESRDYRTVHGIWHYYTKDDGQIDLEKSSYLLIGTLESYRSFCDYYGTEAVVPLYIELDPGERLERALKRERKEPAPRYAELCRRFLADEEDFSEEKLKEAGITARYQNDVIDRCVEEVWKKICQELDLNP